MTFLNVGQGDSVLIRTPLHQRILIDAGKTGSSLIALGDALSPFERTIQLAVLTHPDSDHIGGYSDILRRYSVQYLIHNGATSHTLTYADVTQHSADASIPGGAVQSGITAHFGGEVLLTVLHPHTPLAGATPKNQNVHSIVLRASQGTHAVMLTGDAEIASEKEVVQLPYVLRSHILKLGHHGSRTSSSAAFLAAIAPSEVIVSAAAENSYGHPHKEVLERVGSIPIRETKNGNITITF